MTFSALERISAFTTNVAMRGSDPKTRTDHDHVRLFLTHLISEQVAAETSDETDDAPRPRRQESADSAWPPPRQEMGERADDRMKRPIRRSPPVGS